jgi:hypothetical protein
MKTTAMTNVTVSISIALFVLMVLVSERCYSFQVSSGTFPRTMQSKIMHTSSNIGSSGNTGVGGSTGSLLSRYASTISVDGTAATSTGSSITTGPNGKAAINFDEDLRLTLQIIMDHQLRSTTVSTEQLVQQVTAAAAIDDTKDTIDITIPYDAAAKLAYQNEPSNIQSSMTFDEYKVQYEAKAIADVIAKKKPTATSSTTAAVTLTSNDVSNDISVPYDAAAKLAYNHLSESERSAMDYNTFQQQFVTKAIADVVAKQKNKSSKESSSSNTVTTATPASVATTTTSSDNEYDIAVPYDAAAKLAYERIQSIKHTLSYEQFKVQYEQNSIRNVVNKKLKRDAQQQ